jgi:hypothetical protein
LQAQGHDRLIGLQFGLQLGLRFAPQRPANPLSRISHELGQDVGVLRGHADLGVTEDLHYDALINALGEQQRGRSVPGIVNPHTPDSGGFEQRVPFVPVSVGANRPPVGLAPDEIAIVPGWPSGHALMELVGAMSFERCDELGWERDCAPALVGFQFGEP